MQDIDRKIKKGTGILKCPFIERKTASYHESYYDAVLLFFAYFELFMNRDFPKLVAAYSLLCTYEHAQTIRAALKCLRLCIRI